MSARPDKEPPGMRYGFYLPTRGPTATRDGILALAREGERLGLHSAMVADHIVFPVESQSTYPYTVDGKHPSVGDARRNVPGAEPASADPGRRPCPRRAATHGPAWRRLAPGRRRRRLAVAAAGNACASRHAEATDRGRGSRFRGADDLLQGP